MHIEMASCSFCTHCQLLSKLPVHIPSPRPGNGCSVGHGGVKWGEGITSRKKTGCQPSGWRYNGERIIHCADNQSSFSTLCPYPTSTTSHATTSGRHLPDSSPWASVDDTPTPAQHPLSERSTLSSTHIISSANWPLTSNESTLYYISHSPCWS